MSKKQRVTDSFDCYFVCGRPCRDGVDWHCRECGTRSHYACRGVRGHKKPLRCDHCQKAFTVTTVGYWATSTYETTVPREGQIYDVNYVVNGTIIGVLPYQWKNGEFHQLDAFVARNIPHGLTKQASEHFDLMVEKLKEVKIELPLNAL